MSFINFYAGLMSPFWKLRAFFNIRRKIKVRTADEIVKKIEEFRSIMLSYEAQDRKQEAEDYRNHIEALTWVISGNSSDK